jgi:hypothetical protein
MQNDLLLPLVWFIHNHGCAHRSSRHRNRRRSGRLGARVRSRTKRGERGDREDVLTKGGDGGRRPESGRQRTDMAGGTVSSGARRSRASPATRRSSLDAAWCHAAPGGARSPCRSTEAANRRWQHRRRRSARRSPSQWRGAVYAGAAGAHAGLQP